MKMLILLFLALATAYKLHIQSHSTPALSKQSTAYQLSAMNLSALTLTTDQAAQYDRELTISAYFHSISIQYCLRGQQPISQYEFNYPNQTKYLRIENFPQEWVPFLDINKLVN